MTQQTITLISSIIGPFVTIGGVYLTSTFAFNRERKLVSWKREIERFLELEELVGALVEQIGGYAQDAAEIVESMGRLAAAAGRFRRYKAVKQSLRDLHNCLGRLIDDKRTHRNEEVATRNELETQFESFLIACDSVIGTRL